MSQDGARPCVSCDGIGTISREERRCDEILDITDVMSDTVVKVPPIQET